VTNHEKYRFIEKITELLQIIDKTPRLNKVIDELVEESEEYLDKHNDEVTETLRKEINSNKHQ